MVLRRELLIAIAVAVVVHGFLVLHGLGVAGISFSQLNTPGADLQSHQPWILSMASLTETANSSNAVEAGAGPERDMDTRSSSKNPSQGTTNPTLEKVLASTFADGFSNSQYLALEETDTPAMPAANWILPLKKGYLQAVSSIVVRVWIQKSGSIAGVELLDVRPSLLSESQMREVVDWLANTPMNPAIKNGESVASKRTVEIAFEH